MSESTISIWKIIASWLTFIVSFDMLIILFVIVPYRCGRVVIDSGGEYVCDIWTGWYIFSIISIIIALYSGYRVYRNWNSMVALVARIAGLKTVHTE